MTATAKLDSEPFGDVRRPLPRASHAPGRIYSSPEIYALEKERIWMRDWLCVGRADELPEPGDYMTSRIAGEPIVLARDRAGELAAFANVCAHRGVEVAHGKGNAETFSCPYHGWRYDLSGRLIGAPYMNEAEGFDPARCRLKPIRLDTWQGFMFVNFDDHCEPLADFLGAFADDFGFFDMGELAVAARLECDFDCNWKLVAENVMDNLHIAVVHPVTLGQGVKAEEIDFKLNPRGGYSSFYTHEPRFNDHQPMFGEHMDSLADKPSNFAGAGFMAPNFQLFTYCDNVELSMHWPLDVDRTRHTVTLIFPRKFFDRPDFADKIRTYRDTETQTLGEDADMVRSLQQAMSVRAFVPGRMSHVEKPIHHWLNHYVERMFGTARAERSPT